MLKKQHIALFMLALWALALMAMRNLPWQLDNYDQARQAYAALDLVQNGHWFFQGLPYGGHATKPPLLAWLQALAYALTGGDSWPLALRLPSLCAAFLLMAFLMHGGMKLGGFSTATIAVAAFVFNMLTIRIATLVRTDMLLALFCFLPGLMVFDHVRWQKSWTRADKFLMFFLLLAAVLVKGHVIYAFFLPGLLLFVYMQSKKGAAHIAWCGWKVLLAPLVIFVIALVLAAVFKPGFFSQVIHGEIFSHIHSEAHSATIQPVYYYIPHLFHKWAPWSLMLLLLLIFMGRIASPKRDPALLWLLCWTLGGLVTMSFIPQKRVDRIYPILPVLVLLLTYLVSHYDRPTLLGIAWKKILLVIIMLGASLWTGYAIFEVCDAYANRYDRLKKFSESMVSRIDPELLQLAPPLAEGFACYLEKTDYLTAEQVLTSTVHPEIFLLVNAATYKEHIQPRGFEPVMSEQDPFCEDEFYHLVKIPAVTF